IQRERLGVNCGSLAFVNWHSSKTCLKISVDGNMDITIFTILLRRYRRNPDASRAKASCLEAPSRRALACELRPVPSTAQRRNQLNAGLKTLAFQLQGRLFCRISV